LTGRCDAIRWWSRGLRDRWTHDNVSLVAAGVAFYAMLSVVPAMAALAGIAAAIAGPAARPPAQERSVEAVPDDLRVFVSENLSGTEPVSSTGLTLATAAALLLSLWSASGAAKHLVVAVNLVYSRREHRSYVRVRLLGLLLTAGLAAFLILTAAALAVVPWILDRFDLGDAPEWSLSVARWPILAAGMLLLTAFVYRIAPEEPGRFRLLSRGTATATAVWLVGSVGFSTVVASAAHFRAAYGSLAAVAASLLWFWVFAAAVIVGAQVDVLASQRGSAEE